MRKRKMKYTFSGNSIESDDDDFFDPLLEDSIELAPEEAIEEPDESENEQLKQNTAIIEESNNLQSDVPAAAAGSLDNLFADLNDLVQTALGSISPPTTTMPIPLAQRYQGKQPEQPPVKADEVSNVDQYKERLIEESKKRKGASLQKAPVITKLVQNTSPTTPIAEVASDIIETTATSPQNTVEPIAPEAATNATMEPADNLFYWLNSKEDKTKTQSASQPNPGSPTSGNSLFAPKQTPTNTSASMSKATNSSWIRFETPAPAPTIPRKVGFEIKP
jgi:hypothetical protein